MAICHFPKSILPPVCWDLTNISSNVFQNYSSCNAVLRWRGFILKQEKETARPAAFFLFFSPPLLPQGMEILIEFFILKKKEKYWLTLVCLLLQEIFISSTFQPDYFSWIASRAWAQPICYCWGLYYLYFIYLSTTSAFQAQAWPVDFLKEHSISIK